MIEYTRLCLVGVPTYRGLTNYDDLESVLPCQFSKITKGQDPIEREYLDQACEIQDLLRESEWTPETLYAEIRARDWRAFPYGYRAFHNRIINAMALARHIKANPAFPNVIKEMLTFDAPDQD